MFSLQFFIVTDVSYLYLNGLFQGLYLDMFPSNQAPEDFCLEKFGKVIYSKIKLNFSLYSNLFRTIYKNMIKLNSLLVKILIIFSI